MAKKALKKELEQWLESDVETAFIELSQITDDKLELTIGEDAQPFSIAYPKEYPKASKDKFFVFSEEESLAEWQMKLNEIANKGNIKLADLLTKAAEGYLDGEEEQEEMISDEEPEPEPEKKEKPKKSKEEVINPKEFLEIGSPVATMRLIKDLKNIQKTNPKDLGFSAAPVLDQKSGMENLYQWHVKLFGFDKDTDLYKDMEMFKKKTQQDHILIELRFSKDYPFAPPFVRVVRPRFAFRTGHVTIGGSICMELLTNSGWNSTNDIESILIQIRAEMTGGNARLDAGMSNTYEYTEQEAWEAFNRAAGTHNWNINGLNKNAFDFYHQ